MQKIRQETKCELCKINLEFMTVNNAYNDAVKEKKTPLIYK